MPSWILSFWVVMVSKYVLGVGSRPYPLKLHYYAKSNDFQTTTLHQCNFWIIQETEYLFKPDFFCNTFTIFSSSQWYIIQQGHPSTPLKSTVLHQSLSKYLTAQDTRGTPTLTKHNRNLARLRDLLSLPPQSTTIKVNRVFFLSLVLSKLNKKLNTSLWAGN